MEQIADETGLSIYTVGKYVPVPLNEGFIEIIPPKPKKGALPIPGRYRRKF